MPESHPGIQFTPRRRKPAKRSSGPSESRTAAAVGRGVHRQGARSGPAPQRPYTISGGRHPEKFSNPHVGGPRGQTVTELQSERVKHAQARAQSFAMKQAVLNLLANSSVGKGLEQGKAAYIWRELAPLFGRESGAMPNVSFGASKMIGGVKIGSGKVKLDSKLRPGFLPGINLIGRTGKQTADFATQVLAHELAHTQQPTTGSYYATPEGRAMTEGGAVAFENAVAPLLHSTATRRAPQRDPYVAYLKEFMRKRGLKGALHDQFKGAR